MKYNVHLYAVVRVKIEDIEAGSQTEAIEKAEERFYADPDQLIRVAEYADEVEAALVDEQGDPEYLNSRHYHPSTMGPGWIMDET